MLPLLPFAAGLLAGAAAIGLLRSERARAAINRAEDRLRGAGNLAAARQAPAATARKTTAAQAPAANPTKTAKPKPARKTPRQPAAARTAPPRGGARKSAKAKAGAAS